MNQRDVARIARSLSAAHPGDPRSTPQGLIRLVLGSMEFDERFQGGNPRRSTVDFPRAINYLKSALAMVEDIKPPPYPGHCLHPEKCAGMGACPRDMSCVD